MKSKINWLAAGVAACVQAVALGGVLYVDDDAPPGGDGLSWNTAYRYLQDALRAAQDGDEIRIAGGVYTPDRCESCEEIIIGDRMATFLTPASTLTINGAYRGLTPGGDPDERDAVAFETSLSGDLNGDDLPDFENRNDNSLRVVSVPPAATLQLDSLTAGRARHASGEPDGAAIYVDAGALHATNCRISENRAAAGILLVGPEGASACELSGCEISDNEAIGVAVMGPIRESPLLTMRNCVVARCENASAITGSGISVSSSVHIEECIIEQNIAGEGPSEGLGGGLYSAGNVTVKNCVFRDNSATRGGAIAIRRGMAHIQSSRLMRNTAAAGGGIAVYSAPMAPTVSVRDCVVANNRAPAGGGAWVQGPLGELRTRFVNVTFVSNEVDESIYTEAETTNVAGGAIRVFAGSVAISGCDFIRNRAVGFRWKNVEGGAVGFFSTESSLQAVNCAFAGNLVERGAPPLDEPALRGGAVDIPSAGTLVNCVFAGNSAADSAGAALSSRGLVTAANCTIVENGPVAILNDAPAENFLLQNTIAWRNTREGGLMDQAAQVSGPATVNYSDIQGLDGSLGGAGNIGADPLFSPAITGTWSAPGVYDPNAVQTTLFADGANWLPNQLAGRFINPDTTQTLQSIVASNTADTVTIWGDYSALGGAGAAYAINDYRIQSGSPCIDAGSNALVPPDALDLDEDGDTNEATPLDADGCWRFDDVANAPDTGVGPVPIVDIGAYEVHDCVGDLNNDGLVGVDDLATLLGNFGIIGRVSFCDGDLDGDAAIGLSDLAAQLAAYGQSCE